MESMAPNTPPLVKENVGLRNVTKAQILNGKLFTVLTCYIFRVWLLLNAIFTARLWKDNKLSCVQMGGKA